MLKKGTMNKVKVTAIIALIVLAFSNARAFAFGITVDGKLDEWGVTPDVHGSSSHWTPNAGIYMSEEDTPPSQDRVWPGYGGQKFDVEGMYITSDDMNLYYAIVTGFPSGGANGYPYFPGDIGFDFGTIAYYEYAIPVVNRNGFTQGTLYQVPSNGWKKGLWGTGNPYGYHDDLSDPAYILNGTATATQGGNLIYTDHWHEGNQTVSYNGNHWVIEGYMPWEAFGSNRWQNIRMHWTMSCANDYLNVDMPAHTPEPGSIALLGLGLVGIVRKLFKRSV